MLDWYEKAQEQICQDYDEGLMSNKEYFQAMRELDQEYDDYAREEAENLYNSFY